MMLGNEIVHFLLKARITVQMTSR